MQLCHVVPDAHLALSAKNSGFLFLGRLEPSAVKGILNTGKPVVVAPYTPDGSPEYKTSYLKEYLQQAEALHAVEVICPFVASDGEKTWEVVGEFLKVYKEMGSKLPLMAVPQGKDWVTYEENFMKFFALQDQFHSYGLPAKLMERVGSDFTGVPGTYPNRPWLLRRKISKLIRLGMWEVCLLELGVSGAAEMAECAGQFDRVTRCITGAAFGCALKGRDLKKEGPNHPIPDLDFTAQTKGNEDVVALAYRNMQFLNGFAQGIGA